MIQFSVDEKYNMLCVYMQIQVAEQYFSIRNDVSILSLFCKISKYIFSVCHYLLINRNHAKSFENGFWVTPCKSFKCIIGGWITLHNDDLIRLLNRFLYFWINKPCLRKPKDMFSLNNLQTGLDLFISIWERPKIINCRNFFNDCEITLQQKANIRNCIVTLYPPTYLGGIRS